MKNFAIRIAARISRLIRGEISTRKLIKMDLEVGKQFSREGGVKIDASYCHLITIGDNVTLAPNVHILAHDASLKYFLGVSKVGVVRIGNKVFIGAGSVILPNVKISDNVIISAGSVVTKDIPSNSVYAGNPAQFICSIEGLIAKNMSRMNSRPIFDRSYSMFGLQNCKTQKMKNLYQMVLAFKSVKTENNLQLKIKALLAIRFGVIDKLIF